MGPCGALCAQIWPLGGQNRARGTFASLRSDGEISEVPENTPFCHQVLGRVNLFPVFPSTLWTCHGRCESLTTFQCQVVENEAWPQTDGSLELPPVFWNLTRKAPPPQPRERCGPARPHPERQQTSRASADSRSAPLIAADISVIHQPNGSERDTGRTWADGPDQSTLVFPINPIIKKPRVHGRIDTQLHAPRAAHRARDLHSTPAYA